VPEAFPVHIGEETPKGEPWGGVLCRAKCK